MSDFKAKMHQIRFPLGLRTRPSWGSLQRSPNLVAVFKDLLLREGGMGGRGRKGEEKGRGYERGRERRVGPQLGSLDPPVV